MDTIDTARFCTGWIRLRETKRKRVSWISIRNTWLQSGVFYSLGVLMFMTVREHESYLGTEPGTYTKKILWCGCTLYIFISTNIIYTTLLFCKNKFYNFPDFFFFFF